LSELRLAIRLIKILDATLVSCFMNIFKKGRPALINFKRVVVFNGNLDIRQHDLAGRAKDESEGLNLLACTLYYTSTPVSNQLRESLMLDTAPTLCNPSGSDKKLAIRIKDHLSSFHIPQNMFCKYPGNLYVTFFLVWCYCNVLQAYSLIFLDRFLTRFPNILGLEC